jgi:septal ring factor EnvC (AmiA/AmiB activator)
MQPRHAHVAWACCCLWLKASEAPNDVMREVRGEIARLDDEIDKLEDEIDILGRSIRAAEASGDRAREQVLQQRMAGMEQRMAGMEQQMAELRRKENILLERSSLAGQGVRTVCSKTGRFVKGWFLGRYIAPPYPFRHASTRGS